MNRKFRVIVMLGTARIEYVVERRTLRLARNGAWRLYPHAHSIEVEAL